VRSPLEVYAGARALVLGHTGFVGGWLALRLRELGAEVHGFALPPEDSPNLFEALGLDTLVEHRIGDVRDAAAVDRAFRESRPDVVFHLAAQSRVLRGYAEPLATFTTNAIGTAHVLEALRTAPGASACVVATSDKCYENDDRAGGYRETDALGGRDPYSASKACAELVVAAYRRSFFDAAESGALVASARAGNIVGGGDWAPDRIVPDCVRAIAAGRPLVLRHPDAVRPWQHVLDASSGYLLLGARLLEGSRACASAWNFGPANESEETVADLVARVGDEWLGRPLETALAPPSGTARVEASKLRLNSSKAHAELGWRPRLDFGEAVRWTVEWYRTFERDPRSARALTLDQIRRHREES
jgi:CDP-glucose 4,6-dehydratase